MAFKSNYTTPGWPLRPRISSDSFDVQDFLISNLYTVVVPSLMTIAYFLYNRSTNKPSSHGYPYVGYRAWWEPTFLVRLRFVVSAVEILKSGYTKYKNQGFWVLRNDVDILVLPIKYLDEIRNYTREQLSGIEALASNVLGDYTGIDILVKSDLHVRVLRNYLTPNMGKVMFDARDELNYSFEVDVPKCDDWEEVDIQNIMRWLIARISARTFIGYPACRDDSYIQTSLDYSRDVFTLAFFMHWFPKFLHPIMIRVTPWCRRLRVHTEATRKALAPAIKQWDDAVEAGIEEGEAFTLLSGMLKAAKGSERNVDEIVDRQLISGLASIHTSVMTATWCLLELCRHPEYIEELVEEAMGNSIDDPEWVRNSTTKMPKIDSFICEVSRMHPPSTLLPQRKARVPLDLSNGVHVPVGTHFSFLLGPISQDPEIFPNPEKFDALRYYRKRSENGLIGTTSSQYLAATPSSEHMVFGHGHQACPGRFFAVNEVKLIIVCFLMNYDIKQPDRQRESRLHIPFEEYFVLNPTLTLMLRKKA